MGKTMSVAEAARQLGMTTMRIYQLIARGRLEKAPGKGPRRVTSESVARETARRHAATTTRGRPEKAPGKGPRRVTSESGKSIFRLLFEICPLEKKIEGNYPPRGEIVCEWREENPAHVEEAVRALPRYEYTRAQEDEAGEYRILWLFYEAGKERLVITKIRFVDNQPPQ